MTMTVGNRGTRVGANLLLAGLALAGAACVGQTDMSSSNVNSDLARDVFGLYKLVTWIVSIIGVVVFALLGYLVMRYRERPGDTRIPEQIHGNTTMEIGWTVLPILITLGIAVPTIALVFKAGGPPPQDALQIRVIGHQWWWEFRYPSLGGLVTANELHIPAGKPVNLAITSADVIHSFWIPQFGGKRDAVPTREQNFWFTAEKPGFFVGQCAEYCGDSHALMEQRISVDTPEDFQKWVAAQQADQPKEVAQGSGADTFSAGGCIACHTVRGNPMAMGRIGPDLTHFGSRKTLGSGMLDNTPEHLARWLADPQGVKPGSKMILPRKLEQAEIASVSTYLTSLK